MPMPSVRRGNLLRARVAAGLLAVCAALTASAADAPRLPMPPKAEMDAAAAELDSTFGKARSAAKDAKAHAALAKQFSQLAQDEKRPAARYILLQAALEEA